MSISSANFGLSKIDFVIWKESGKGMQVKMKMKRNEGKDQVDGWMKRERERWRKREGWVVEEEGK